MRFRIWPLWLFVLTIVACSPAQETAEIEDSASEVDAGVLLTLPNLEASSDEDGPIRIVATTGIIGDVALNIAGEDAEVETLMAPNQDPHTYQTTAGDLRLAASADAVLINGWRLEEGLIDDLVNAAGDVPLIPVSAGIKPRYFSNGEAGSGGNRVDPHVWLAPANVIVWADNIEFVLSTLDPENSGAYAKRADSYRKLLRELDAEFQRRLEPLQSEQRMLVTNHDAFGYFADAYGFTVVGTILPGDSSLAEPSSQELAALVERMREASICALFMEHSANQRLASQLAAELDHCDTVGIVALYSGALGDAGSGAETYLKLMEANLDMVTTALAPVPGASIGS